MKKIGDVTSTADKNGEWTNGNVAAGIAPTILEAGWLNSVQREILGVLVEAGIAQDKNNDNQLKDAIKKIISNWNYATPEDLKKYLAKDQNGADIPNKPKFIENLRLPELFQPLGTYADGKVFKALAGDGASMAELSEKFVLALREDGTVVLHDRIKGKSLWAIVGGVLAQATGYDAGLIMSQKAITDALNLLTPLSSFTSGAGWIRFPDGTIMQWGTSVAGWVGNPTDITFPIPFAVQAYTIVANYDQAKSGDNQCPAIGVQPMGASWFRMVTSKPPEAGVKVLARWYALGR